MAHNVLPATNPITCGFATRLGHFRAQRVPPGIGHHPQVTTQRGRRTTYVDHLTSCGGLRLTTTEPSRWRRAGMCVWQHVCTPSPTVLYQRLVQSCPPSLHSVNASTCTLVHVCNLPSHQKFDHWVPAEL